MSEMVLQHTVVPRRRFLVLTNEGLYVLIKNRNVNLLAAALESPSANAVRRMFKR